MLTINVFKKAYVHENVKKVALVAGAQTKVILYHALKLNRAAPDGLTSLLARIVLYMFQV